MPHIHDLIDFTVGAYIVHNNKVLLIDHKQLKTWLAVGGHIELDEDPEEALMREVKEESGLDIKIVGEKPKFEDKGFKSLIAPVYMDIHDINETHKHIGLVYFATADTDEVVLAEAEHNDIRWFSKDELSDPQYNIRPSIRFYAEQALNQLSK